MFAPTRLRSLGMAAPLPATANLPAFLLPAFQTTAPRRALSATAARQSRLGRRPVYVPPEVEVSLGEPYVVEDLTTYLRIPRRNLTVSGPLGKLDIDVPPFMKVDYDTATRMAKISVEDTSIPHQRAMWGTTWSYLKGYITGVSEGHTAILRLVGVGYRATIEERPDKEEYPGQKFVCLKLGFTHPVEEGVPKGITASTPQPTRILLEGIDKAVVNQFAAIIRSWRKPEPYKGKGIFVNDETIKLKQKRIT